MSDIEDSQTANMLSEFIRKFPNECCISGAAFSPINAANLTIAIKKSQECRDMLMRMIIAAEPNVEHIYLELKSGPLGTKPPSGESGSIVNGGVS